MIFIILSIILCGCSLIVDDPEQFDYVIDSGHDSGPGPTEDAGQDSGSSDSGQDDDDDDDDDDDNDNNDNNDDDNDDSDTDGICPWICKPVDHDQPAYTCDVYQHPSDPPTEIANYNFMCPTGQICCQPHPSDDPRAITEYCMDAPGWTCAEDCGDEPVTYQKYCQNAATFCCGKV